MSKVKVSGGGRCNVTNACFLNSELIKNYPRGGSFLKKSFSYFNTSDTVKWFEDRGIELKTEADGRLFPVTDSSETIVDCLIREANKHGVELFLNTSVEGIDREDGRFKVSLNRDRTMIADKICLASGGLSYAQSSHWISKLGHQIIEPLPSLFTFNIPGDPITELMGIAVNDVIIKIQGSKLQQRGPMLITHWGLSGPSVLKLSAWSARELAALHYETVIVVNWLPEYNENTLRTEFQQLRFSLASQKMNNRNPLGLPSRLWDHLLNVAGVKPETRWADLPAKEQNLLVKLLTAQSFNLKGKTTFKEEFVTAGGISCAEVNPATMESKIMPGLYFAGELLDVDGITGGFNFQNAWTTGYIAARHIASSQDLGIS